MYTSDAFYDITDMDKQELGTTAVDDEDKVCMF